MKLSENQKNFVASIGLAALGGIIFALIWKFSGERSAFTFVFMMLIFQHCKHVFDSS